MLALLASTTPKLAAWPAKLLYCLARPTWSVAFLTMGRNPARSCSRLVLFRYWVAESSGPERMPLASCTVIFFTASTSSAWASGTAASAALFMLASSWSTWAPMPIIFMVLAALPSLPGSSMRTSGSR